MNVRGCIVVLLAFLMVGFFSQPIISRGLPSEAKYKAKKALKITTNDVYVPISINGLFNYYGNNGDGSFNPYSPDNEGFEFPKGTHGDIQFEDGIVWGGYQQGVLKVGGSTYNHGLQAGKILVAGTTESAPVADSFGSSRYHIFRVRPDINPTTPLDTALASLQSEASLISRYQTLTVTDLYNQYISDWNNWPSADGAPYTDVNGNGSYDP